MITGRTHVLGVVVADIENPFFSAVLRGISDAGAGDGYDTIVTNSDEIVEVERAATRVFLEKRVDGIIAAPASPVDVAHLQAAIRAGCPMAVIDRRVWGLAADVVVIRNVAAAATAVRALIDRGHRRVAVVGGRRTVHADGEDDLTYPLISTAQERLRGYRDALRRAQLPVDDRYVALADLHDTDPAELTRQLLDLPDRPTAILALNSQVALGVLDGIQSRGLSIPRDVSVVTFDNATWTRVSVVDQPAHEMGRTAVRLLLDRIADPTRPARKVLLDACFLDRGSIGPPPP